MKSGKIWGQTEAIVQNSSLELHRIEVHPDTHCSKHKHSYKWNGFYVEKGRIGIRVWKNDYDLVDETILEAGDYTEVKPGDYHQFFAVGSEMAVVFEVYFANFQHEDIVRESVGGFDNPEAGRITKKMIGS